MLQPPVHLPSEIWSLVFRYLPVKDKFSVRASCRYFKKLVDHASQWKNWTVVLTFPNGSYDNHFWATLRRRKVSSAVVRSRRAKHWRRLSAELPALSTVVIDETSRESVQCLRHFTNLKRLSVRSSLSCIPHVFVIPQPEQLTHLSLCNVNFSKTSLSSFLSSVSKFSSLTSLVCHQLRIFEDSAAMLHSILSRLPNLKHLSLSVRCAWYTPHLRPNPDPLQTAPLLSSLELTEYTDQSLPEHVMKLMPGLKSLAVFYRNTPNEAVGVRPPQCHLRTWLRDLPHLSTLVVVRGWPVAKYVSSIPATVTSLTLCIPGTSSMDLADVAAQAPNLLHLHVDPWPSHLGMHTSQIPQLFPRLKSLKLRHEYVPPRDFLRLHQLRDLEYLEILDSRPQVTELIRRLQGCTNYRPQITARPGQRDVMSCPCVSQVY